MQHVEVRRVAAAGLARARPRARTEYGNLDQGVGLAGEDGLAGRGALSDEGRHAVGCDLRDAKQVGERRAFRPCLGSQGGQEEGGRDRVPRRPMGLAAGGEAVYLCCELELADQGGEPLFERAAGGVQGAARL